MKKLPKLKVGNTYAYCRENLTGDYVEYTITGLEKDEVYYRLHISNSYDNPYDDVGNMSIKDFKAIIYAGNK